MIRREAFNYSEKSYRHLLSLMLADRIGMVEGVIEDLARGRVPNIFGKLGLKAEWKHNRANLATKIVVGTVLASIAVAYFRGRRDESED